MFPSPIGVLYISMQNPFGFNGASQVSVPYWGSLYFNELLYHERTGIRSFPSPIGVLYISIAMTIEEMRQSMTEFPSPIGVLYISIYKEFDTTYTSF